MSTNKLIQDLILFYVKENYNKYLEDHKIKEIPEKDIADIISQLYVTKKEHIQTFLKDSLKQLMKDEYFGDQNWEGAYWQRGSLIIANLYIPEARFPVFE